ncbi:HNH endonuclease [Natrialba swarupiae]|uniref:HNH endonuclease n=1 Tax=Natrialba swarupiae TaxID=2448032 RepID=UPI00192E3113|nr:HNH endonuclease [Natrialba swarupiae]
MTTSSRHGDPDAVFERDERVCRRCEASADEDPNGLALYPVGDVPETGPVHESALVTVCSPCLVSLESDPDEDVELDDDALFDLVRQTTERQGVTVSAVAAFASLATELPSELEISEQEDDLGSEYVQVRREVLLAIDSVDSRLDHLHAVDDADLEPTVAEPLAAFRGGGTKLQSELRGIVALGESVAAGVGRCHGCFDPIVDGESQCPTCGLEYRDADDWRPEPGDDVAFHRLFEAVNEALQAASGTTKSLTGHTTAVAKALRG